MRPQQFNIFLKKISWLQFFYKKGGHHAYFYLFLSFFAVSTAVSAQVNSPEIDEGSTASDDSFFSSFRLNGQARLRYSHVNNDGFPNNANNLTLRGLVALSASPFPKTDVLIEGEGVLAVVDDFNDGSPFDTDFPFIPDSDGIELNRAQIVTEIIPKTRLTLGRQRIVFDDGRFIGDSVFRQNNQTFDAVRSRIRFLETGFFDAAYIRNVLRPFGADSPVGRFNGDSYALNANVQTPIGRVTGFHYALDLNTRDTPEPISTSSSQTTGVMLRGRRHWDGKGLVWEAGYANQRDFADNPLDYEADYFTGLLRGEIGGFRLTGKYESLGGSDEQGFQTPIASLRGFQGFADVFLITPVDGVEDISVQGGYKFGDIGPLKDVRGFVRHHWFSAARGGQDYGTELDGSISFSAGPVRAQIDLALYDSDGFASDSQSVFLTLTRPF